MAKQKKFPVQVNFRASEKMKGWIDKDKETEGWSQDRTIRELIRRGRKYKRLLAENEALQVRIRELESEREAAMAENKVLYEQVGSDIQVLIRYSLENFADFLQDKDGYPEEIVRLLVREKIAQFQIDLWQKDHDPNADDEEDREEDDE